MSGPAHLLAEAVATAVAEFSQRHGVARPAVRLVLSDGQALFAGGLEPLDHPGLLRLLPPAGLADPPRIVVVAVAAVTRFEVIAEGPAWTGRRSPGE